MFLRFFVGIICVLWGLAGNSQTRWWNGAVAYEIFVRSFQDSNGDGHGDINGVTSRLDYLKSLGVNVIWLTPIFPSPSYHGYDATDYKSINPQMGTMVDFKRLIQESHRRGIRIIMDVALNHTSNQHPWFKNRVNDVYVWREQNPGWPGNKWNALNGLFYYAFFGPTLPDLNWQNNHVRTEMKSVLNFWVQQGVDGFRLDAVRYLTEGPQGQSDTRENHAVLADAVQSVKKMNPNILFVGEVWADSQTIGPYVNQRNEMDMCFNFPLAGGLLGSLQNERALDFDQALQSNLQFISSQNYLSAFITNHDMTRVASILPNSLDKLKLAAYLMFTSAGMPVIYYGEEIGMTSGGKISMTRNLADPRSDIQKRTPMQWTTAPNHGFTAAASKPWNPFSSNDPQLTVQTQASQSQSLLTTYRQLIQLKKNQLPALVDSVRLLHTNDKSISATVTQSQGATFISIVNFSRTEKFVALTIPKTVRRAIASQIIWGSAPADIQDSATEIRINVPKLSAYTSLLIKVQAR